MGKYKAINCISFQIIVELFRMVLKCGNQSGNFRGKRKLIAELLQNLQNFCRQIEKKSAKSICGTNMRNLRKGFIMKKERNYYTKKIILIQDNSSYDSLLNGSQPHGIWLRSFDVALQRCL